MTPIEHLSTPVKDEKKGRSTAATPRSKISISQSKQATQSISQQMNQAFRAHTKSGPLTLGNIQSAKSKAA